MESIEAHRRNFELVGDDGPDFVRSLRRRGLDRFVRAGFPSTRLEDWKFTDVTPLAKVPFRLARGSDPERVDAATLAALRLDVPAELVFVDGRHAPSLSRFATLPPGVEVVDLAGALRTDPKSVEASLARLADEEIDPFVALSTAFLGEGAYVRVGRNARAADPIHLLFLSTGAPEPTIAHPRVLVVAEEGSRATVVETHGGTGAGVSCTNAVTEIHLGPNAEVAHCRLQLETEEAFHVGTVQAHQEGDSRFASLALSIGGRLARCNVNTRFDGPGAECTLDGLYVAHGAQHVDFHTTIDHARPHGTSRELYKGVLAGRSSAVFNGKVVVRPKAQKSDAGQVNRNLLLSENATVNTKPQLEIFADDVKCSHGAAIGRLDPDALFFLRARGIGPAEARRLLIFGFANEVIGRIPVEAVRGRLESLLRSRFEDGPVAAGETT